MAAGIRGAYQHKSRCLSWATPENHGHGSCLLPAMEPIPLSAIAVKSDFRCDGNRAQGSSWDWQCRSRDGAVVATSHGCFRTLRDAVADANKHGFGYELKPGAR